MCAMASESGNAKCNEQVCESTYGDNFKMARTICARPEQNQDKEQPHKYGDVLSISHWLEIITYRV